MKEKFNKNFFKENKIRTIIFFILIILFILTIVFNFIEERMIESLPKTTTVDYTDDRINNEVTEKYSTDDIEVTKKVSKEFIEAIYVFNGDNSSEGIEKASFLCSETLRKELEMQSKSLRSTEDFYYRSLDNIELIQADVTENDNEFLWKVKVTGTIKNKSGKVSTEDTSVYLIKLFKQDGLFKVTEYIINPR